MPGLSLLARLAGSGLVARLRGLGLFAGWRGLGRFWGIVLSLLVICAALLQLLGAPAGSKGGREVAAIPPVRSDSHSVAPETAKHEAPHAPPVAVRPGRSSPGPLTDPDPGLLESYPGSPDRKLPRIASDGRMPMAIYAAPFDPSSVRPKVAIVVGGIGMSEADSVAAVRNLPGGVTLAISPYASHPDHLLVLARMMEHEYLLSLPMEPQGYPVNDPDDRHALMTSLPPSENLDRLRWVLSRMGGYVGATSLLGPMRGERLLNVADQRDSVMEELAHRGLLFIDARQNAARPSDARSADARPADARPADARSGDNRLAFVWSRVANLVIDDDPADEATIDQRLEMLSRMARDTGSALGIVSVPRPTTLNRVAAWANTLTAKGLALAPVSALVMPPATREPEK